MDSSIVGAPTLTYLLMLPLQFPLYGHSSQFILAFKGDPANATLKMYFIALAPFIVLSSLGLSNCLVTCYNQGFLAFKSAFVLALAGTLSCQCLSAGIYFFQWFFFSKDLNVAQEIFLEGVLFPLYSAMIGRLLFSDFVAYMVVRYGSTFRNGDWTDNRAVTICATFIALSRILTALPGLLTLINVKEPITFFIGSFASNLVELVGIVSWPRVAKMLFARTDQKVKTAVSQDHQPTKLLDPKYAALSLLDLTSEWLAAFHQTGLQQRAALNVAYESRIEACALCAVTAVTLYINVVEYQASRASSILLRGVFLLMLETVTVDVLKLWLLQKLYNVRPLRRGPLCPFRAPAEFVGVLPCLWLAFSSVFITDNMRKSMGLGSVFN